MLTNQTKAIPHPDVVCTELRNGDTVLLHLDTQTYYTVNETGSCIWELMGNGLNLGQISHALEAKYEVSTEKAQQSVFNLTQDLVEAQLISLNGDQQPGLPDRDV